ncbi:MAG: response regulator [Deltaproteobacteria bacterium]|nr:response regulator [Deltaproteobacteria bacterium]MBW1918712.1 response regulator [Deltaproteobacteria bacterium]MBW1934499.1 response regulator [Deltaproteobacteria bacterium]MBW1977121.1 response regulator [Deltaproteobacteria bacterium]MBW2044595.1 response regulator [Deltaproteobacteria bacterium]
MAINILIIEADGFLHDHLSRYLEGKDCRVFEARKAGEVKRVFKKNDIDVALIGLSQLKRKGLDFLKMVKKANPTTEVILISNPGQLSFSIQGMKLGAFDDFPLPLNLNSLISRISEAYKKRKMLEKRGFAFRGSNASKETNLINREDEMKEMKVLLVDDEEEFIKTLAERIKMRDLKSDVALNGEEALKFVDNQAPDVMVLDLKMPGIDGMEVLRRVRKAYPEVQVIILTGHGSKKDEEEARRLGAFQYLQKPVELEKLLATIKEAYKKKFEGAMTAAAFAEGGDFDTAKEILKHGKKK